MYYAKICSAEYRKYINRSLNLIVGSAETSKLWDRKDFERKADPEVSSLIPLCATILIPTMFA